MNVRAYNYFWRGSVITSKRKKIDFVHFSGDGRFAYLPAGKDKMRKASHKKAATRDERPLFVCQTLRSSRAVILLMARQSTRRSRRA